ncbi:MarC family protein [Roseobacter sp. HKCCA0434]|uniref:MarC family protein n=1 Tax=Roseobacter sp. HKCCA0434 TaxID=3079297 RepID=UPI00290592CC|nr:MarC family protein [Roseobacter sp. HKCCA0434]
MIEIALTAFVTLFVIIDPIGLTPIFVALTPGASRAQRRRIAVRAVAIAFVILLSFALAGEALLDAVGIGMPAFRISGGVLLFLIAVEMLFEKRNPRRSNQADDPEPERDPSVFPLALPLLAGPGAMATMVLLVGQADDLATQAVLVAVMALVLGIALGLFLIAGLMERLIGQVGVNVITRILGVLLAALATQFILDGLRAAGVVG